MVEYSIKSLARAKDEPEGPMPVMHGRVFVDVIQKREQTTGKIVFLGKFDQIGSEMSKVLFGFSCEQAPIWDVQVLSQAVPVGKGLCVRDEICLHRRNGSNRSIESNLRVRWRWGLKQIRSKNVRHRQARVHTELAVERRNAFDLDKIQVVEICVYHVCPTNKRKCKLGRKSSSSRQVAKPVKRECHRNGHLRRSCSPSSSHIQPKS